MTDEIKEKAFKLAAGVCLPGTRTEDIIAKAREIEAYLREGGLADAGIPELRHVKYRGAPAQTIALDEAEERDD